MISNPVMVTSFISISSMCILDVKCELSFKIICNFWNFEIDWAKRNVNQQNEAFNLKRKSIWLNKWLKCITSRNPIFGIKSILYRATLIAVFQIETFFSTIKNEYLWKTVSYLMYGTTKWESIEAKDAIFRWTISTLVMGWTSKYEHKYTEITTHFTSKAFTNFRGNINKKGKNAHLASCSSKSVCQ